MPNSIKIIIILAILIGPILIFNLWIQDNNLDINDREF